MKIDLKANEMVVKASDTNHLVGGSERIKGKLILTNQRIYFKSGNGDAGKFDMEIEPKNIRDVLYFNTGLLFANGLNLVTQQGEQLRFVIKKRNAWGEMIANMC
nr:hypothetical protein [Bacteroidota bacterium]